MIFLKDRVFDSRCLFPIVLSGGRRICNTNCSLVIKHLRILNIFQHLRLFSVLTMVLFFNVSHFLFYGTVTKHGVLHLTKRLDWHHVFRILDAQFGFALRVRNVCIGFNHHPLLLPGSEDLLFQACLIGFCEDLGLLDYAHLVFWVVILNVSIFQHLLIIWVCVVDDSHAVRVQLKWLLNRLIQDLAALISELFHGLLVFGPLQFKVKCIANLPLFLFSLLLLLLDIMVLIQLTL